jgi:hypothetical protein
MALKFSHLPSDAACDIASRYKRLFRERLLKVIVPQDPKSDQLVTFTGIRDIEGKYSAGREPHLIPGKTCVVAVAAYYLGYPNKK